MNVGLAWSIFRTSSRAVCQVKAGLPLDPLRLSCDADCAVTCALVGSLVAGAEVRFWTSLGLRGVSSKPGRDRGEEERCWPALGLKLPDLAR